MISSQQTTKLREKLAIAYHDYEKGLKIHAMFKINNSALSEDLVQNTFIKTWIYLVKKGKIETMKAFLYHVLNNLVVDEYRKKKTGSLEVFNQKSFEPSDSNFKKISIDIDGKKMLLLIKKLPKKFQKIMNMRYVKDLSLQEMSDITGQSKKTIAVQACRGLKMIKVLYTPRIAIKKV